MSIWFKSKTELFRIIWSKTKIPVIVFILYAITTLQIQISELKSDRREEIYKLDRIIYANRENDKRLRYIESATAKLINISDVNYQWNIHQDVRLANIESENEVFKYNLLNLDNGQSKDRRNLTNQIKQLVSELRATNNILAKELKCDRKINR